MIIISNVLLFGSSYGIVMLCNTNSSVNEFRGFLEVVQTIFIALRVEGFSSGDLLGHLQNAACAPDHPLGRRTGGVVT